MRAKPTKEKSLNFLLTLLRIKNGKNSRLSEGKEGRNYENEIATLNTYQCGLLRGRIE
jgi:hypothetical protein